MSVLVSVIMPCFNSKSYIDCAIYSVQDQSVSDWELLIVDGGSTDGTRTLVRDICAEEPRIRLIENDDDLGPAHARSVGVKQAQGRYLAFLDADDYWLPEKLENQIFFMRSSGAQFSFTRYRSVSADGRRLGCLVPMYASYNYLDALRYRGIGTLTVVVDRELMSDDVISVWKRAGGEEYLWWLLALRKGVTAYLLDKDLARYRDTAGSLSKNIIYTVKSVWSMYRNELDLSLLATIAYFISYIFDSGCRKIGLKICGVFHRWVAEIL